ncbi:PREDICTED: calcium-binding mitochondrial carrier protein SCaMC-1-B-like isoform X1 [Branchiostoma belcheri]|uniref:Calcium-binding mitochondrial carrier protein SCaMC-1-B-like isoform X1 n=1 Tax=Branchiostoma belcheri TaxID=7741 RepID=A0A6P5AG14_BRABE|nr:PREDICTED: calcium-binding mitochondrial carrier protein SCaMC-1-B-like isoform X1 [Branchiostoma belcheri]
MASTRELHELSAEEEEQFTKLFKRLDASGDGRIDFEELREGLKKLGVHSDQAEKHAQEILKKSDKDDDEEIEFAEFVKYMSEHQRKLKLTFDKLDKNKDGRIDTEEIIEALRGLGVHIDKSEANKIMKSFTLRLRTFLAQGTSVFGACRCMDKDGTLTVDWDEWREYLLLHPSADLKDIVRYWRHTVSIDIGENLCVPDEFTEEEKVTGMWWRQLVAGGTAGAVSRTCTAPLDRLKVLLQVHGANQARGGIMGSFQQMLKEGGVKGLWRGNGMNVLKIAPESAIKFMAYERLKKLFTREGQSLGVVERFCSGSLAGMISQTSIYPMEVLKTRLAIRKTGQYSGMWDCAVKIYQREGLRAFYKGYIPNILGVLPYAGIDLCIYETLKIMWVQHSERWLRRNEPQETDDDEKEDGTLKNMYLAKNKNQPNPGVMVLLACGTISSTCGQLASYPLALIRTRLQAQTTPIPGRDTMVGLFQGILKDEGLRGLYRGIAPNFMKVAPAVSISYVVYEKTRSALGVNSK